MCEIRISKSKIRLEPIPVINVGDPGVRQIALAAAPVRFAFIRDIASGIASLLPGDKTSKTEIRHQLISL